MAGILSFVSLAVGVVGAGLGVRAATVEIRNNQDKFIEDLKRQSRWQRTLPSPQQ